MLRPFTFFYLDFLRPWAAGMTLLVQAESAIIGSYVGNGMLVDEDVPLDFQKDGKIVERLDIPLHLIT